MEDGQESLGACLQFPHSLTGSAGGAFQGTRREYWPTPQNYQRTATTSTATIGEFDGRRL